MPDHDLDALGAQYRAAKAAVATHRAYEAAMELAFARARRRHQEGSPQIAAAWAAVTKARGDVRWCQAATIAAGEAYKGMALGDVPQDRSALPAFGSVAEQVEES